jgi:ADP-heptose:LPS heptosyltransferase
MNRRRRAIDKVLVIKLGELREFVAALAAMQHIRLAHPQAKITLLTTAPFEALAKASPYFDAVEADGRAEGFRETLALIRRLRNRNYDRVYDLQNSSLTNLYFQALRPFPPQWSGTAAGCSLPHRNRARAAMHPLERQAEQLMDAGIWPDAPIRSGAAPPPDLSWIVERAAGTQRVALAARPRPYVLFVPGPSEEQPQMRWPAEQFGKLGVLLRAQGFDILVIGGPQESGLARTIQHVAQARDLTGRTDFAQIAALGARAALAVGNDTGLLHLIAAAGAPTLALFSKASDPCLSGPRGHVAVLQAERLQELAATDVAAALQRLLPADAKTV